MCTDGIIYTGNPSTSGVAGSVSEGLSLMFPQEEWERQEVRAMRNTGVASQKRRVTVHVCLTVLIKCNNRSPFRRVISQLARRKTSPGFHLFDLHCRHLLSHVPLSMPSLWPSLFQPTYSSSDCASFFPHCYPDLNRCWLRLRPLKVTDEPLL